MRNSRLESGILLSVEVLKYTKLKANEKANYRGKVDIRLSYQLPNKSDLDIVVIPNVVMSGLAAYNFATDKSRYLGKQFISLNTSPSFHENPFMIVKSGDKYYLYMVFEGGKRYVDVVMPGGITHQKIEYSYKKPENYVRYLDADALRKNPEQPVAAPKPETAMDVAKRELLERVQQAIKPATPQQAFGDIPNENTPSEIKQMDIRLRKNEIERLGWGANEFGNYEHPKCSYRILKDEIDILSKDEWDNLLSRYAEDIELNMSMSANETATGK